MSAPAMLPAPMKPIFFMNPPARSRQEPAQAPKSARPSRTQGRALLDGDREIVAHSHREVG